MKKSFVYIEFLNAYIQITCFELDSKIPIDLFDKMESAAKEACQEIATIMQNAVVDRFSHLVVGAK